jgi:60 kDa SS-A/Ro ribonucleoprotein
MEATMANKSLFASFRKATRTDTLNHEGAPAYAMKPRHVLAQLAVTGTLNSTFYADAEAQLRHVVDAALEVDAAFIAKTAVYARERGYMKDIPALLVALLSMLQAPEFVPAFRRVIDNGKMLRNFVQIMRSGVAGRTSLGSRPKRLVEEWLAAASDAEIMRAAVGQSPSLADVIKMVHPKPADASREALYAYLIGKPYDVAVVPEVVRNFEAFKRNIIRSNTQLRRFKRNVRKLKQLRRMAVPDVPFQMLTALPLSAEQWAAIGKKAGWHMLRMNLNTFARHDAFGVKGFTRHVVERLADAKAIKRAKVFPYQLMVAFAMAGRDVPQDVRNALQDAMEIAIANVPRVDGRIVVCPDVSGSMRSPVTGYRPGATSAVRCIDVAALLAAAFMRTNGDTLVLPFEQRVVKLPLNPRDSVMTNATKLAQIGGGGTNCSAPILKLVEDRVKADLVVIVSDNESWIDARGFGQRTGLMAAWDKYKAMNRKAKLVCIDIQPGTTSQAVERHDILSVGGFSDSVFEAIATFAQGRMSAAHWVGEIEAITL